jgi:hypothetical protein
MYPGTVLCCVLSGLLKLLLPPRSVVPKVWGAPPGGGEEILKGDARGAKLFYSLKINKKHKYN